MERGEGRKKKRPVSVRNTASEPERSEVKKSVQEKEREGERKSLAHCDPKIFSQTNDCA